ncbi:hypothetical protein CDIK_4587, partial [Cucumispora dikerogammari]
EYICLKKGGQNNQGDNDIDKCFSQSTTPDLSSSVDIQEQKTSNKASINRKTEPFSNKTTKTGSSEQTLNVFENPNLSHYSISIGLGETSYSSYELSKLHKGLGNNKNEPEKMLKTDDPVISISPYVEKNEKKSSLAKPLRGNKRSSKFIVPETQDKKGIKKSNLQGQLILERYLNSKLIITVVYYLKKTKAV